jgi:hypothetical protein
MNTTLTNKVLLGIVSFLLVLLILTNMEYLVDNIQSLEVIEILVSILFALIISILSIYGIRTWRVELKGKNRYQLAKNILTSTYKIRDRIQQVQHPFVSVHEFNDRKSDKYETENQKMIADSFYAFTNRFKNVQKELDDWYSLKLETEALFGKDKRNILERLDDIISRLYRAISLYHEYKYHDNFDPNNHKKYENIIYGISPSSTSSSTGLDNNDGGFKEDLINTVEIIEKEFSDFI